MGESISRGQYEPESLMVTGDLLTFSVGFAVLAIMISTCSFVPRGTFPFGDNSAAHNRMLVCGRGSIIGVPEEEVHDSSQGQEVRPDERSRVAQPKRASAPLAGDEAARPPHDEPSKSPVCGYTVHPFNLARALDGRIVGCLRCP